jgi:hypothetical protein
MANPSISHPTKIAGPLVVEPRGANPKAAGQQIGDSGYQPVFSIRVPTGYAYNVLEIDSPAPYGKVAGVPTGGVVLAAIDPAGGLLLSGAILSSRRVTRVAVTAAQLIAMYTTPVVILPAPALGIGLVIDKILFEMTTTATAFSGGGVVTFQYGVTAHGAGTGVHAGAIPAATVTAGAGVSATALWAASGTSASGVYISNATGVFAAGTGTAIVVISYDVLTLG